MAATDTDLDTIAPVFIEIAHRIVWCTVATASVDGDVRTRILHPYWEHQDGVMTGWVLTSPRSPKAQDLRDNPRLSLTYWDPSQDVATAECRVAWEDTPEERAAGWKRFAEAPAPVGYAPSLIPQWTSPDAPEFGVLRLEPVRLRTMPGSFMFAGQGQVHTWRA